MNSTISRRQILAATVCTLGTATAAFAATLFDERPQIIRELATWREGDDQWRCWMQGHVCDVPQVVADAERIWSSSMMYQHLNTQDLEWLFGEPKRLDIPLLRVGCATSHSTHAAAQLAFQRAGGNPLHGGAWTKYAGLILVSANSQNLMLETYKEMLTWEQQHISQEIYYGMQFLVDPSLANGCKRASVAIAK